MNLSDYTYLINKPDAINEKQTDFLGEVVDEFPYFQSARALRLKGLFNQDSFRYNYALKVTASHTTDRSVLFDFITSDIFVVIQKGYFDAKIKEINNIKVVDSEIIESKKFLKSTISTIEQSIISTIKVATGSSDEPKIVSLQESIQIGKPLSFSKSETHSFQEWLQLSKWKPIVRDSQIEEQPSIIASEVYQHKKSEIIDKFIQASPKIPPIKANADFSFKTTKNKSEESFLMTETLARVYLEQKKYDRAIQAYEILILKYPEKSSLFANQILEIKFLQQNNS